MYFKWQWLRDAYGEHPRLQNALAVVLPHRSGCFGGWVHWQRDRRSFWYFGPLMVTMTFVLIYYLNFKYGHSQAPELGGQRAARGARPRLLLPVELLGVERLGRARPRVSCGSRSPRCSAARRRARSAASTLRPADARAAGPAGLAACCAMACVPLRGQLAAGLARRDRPTPPTSRSTCSTRWSRTASSSPSATTTPSRSGMRRKWRGCGKDVHRREHLAAQHRLVHAAADPPSGVSSTTRSAGPAVYRGRTWTKPDGPALKMTFDEADAIPLYVELGEQRTFQKDEPDRHRAQRHAHARRHSDLLPHARLVARAPALLQPHRRRPARGSWAWSGTCSRRGWRAASPRRPWWPACDTVLVRGEGYVDVARSAALWRDTYEGNRSLAARNGWVDDASVGIPDLYVISGLTISEALANADRGALSDSVFREARAIAQGHAPGAGVRPRPSGVRPAARARAQGPADLAPAAARSHPSRPGN